jgi:bifunctional DNA-binding transcriptional regulator/antitoxin component of YhaV-PrlF toxin-antitoxin module
MAGVEATAGFAHLDEKGRMPIAKPIRDAFGLHAGSTVAWVKVGGGLMIIPQDEHLAQVMEDAAAALERAGITVEDLLAGLDEARDEMVTEYYGAAFMNELEALGAEPGTAEKPR